MSGRLKNNSLYFKASTEDSELKDPYFFLEAGSDFQTENHPWMVIKLKNLSEVTTFEMHYGTSIHEMTGATVVHFDIKAKDNDYQTYVVNIPEANLEIAYPLNGPGGIAEQAGSTIPPIDKLSESTWEGTLTTLRFDCLYKDGASGNVPDGAEMHIEYAAFFSSENDAEAFAKSGPDRSNYVAPPTATPIPEKATAASTPAAKTNGVKSPSSSSSLTAPTEKSNTKVIIIVVAAVAVAAGVIIAIVLVNKKKKNNKES